MDTLSGATNGVRICKFNHHNFHLMLEFQIDKHGTCAMSLKSIDSQHKYFSFAIDMHTQLAIAQTLENAGFNPSNNNQYSMSSMLNALQQQFGQTPEVTCTNLSGLGNAIDGVTFCIDKSFKLISCPSSLKTRLHSSGTSCSSQVYFPPISH
jgi:ribonuclease T2